ncbi:MAG: hypothetical protein IH598_15310 [Bacteroidales bacterium]|nr:hypothetical protein [Bacteroidales bacterium]
MKKSIALRINVVIFMFMCSFQIDAQVPSWVDFDSRRQNYPADFYLTGFSSAKREASKSIDEQFRVLNDFARAELIESISVTVTSQSLLFSEENTNTYRENFTQTTVSFANAELTGLKSETWEDKKGKQLYAFVYVRISDLRDFYETSLNQKRETVVMLLNEAEQYRAENKNESALKSYRDCLPLLAEIESGSAIVQALTRQVHQGDLQQLTAQVRRGLEEISNIVATNPDEASSILADAIASALKEKNVILQVFPFTYQDSRMAANFSGAFLPLLKQKIIEKKISVVEPSANIEHSAVDALLTGVYWVENDRLRLIATVCSLSGSLIAGAEALLAKDWLVKNNLSWLPEKFEEAGARNKVFTENEIVGGGLNLELLTNKGNENLLFAENDTLLLYVRTNHECYLRFVYYMADGSKVLLMNDYYVNSDQVNKVVQIPETFICAEPFGSEMLVLNGQTSPFPPLKTTTSYGYTFIEDDVKTIVAQSRGFKRVSNQTLNGEKRLIMNTIGSK